MNILLEPYVTSRFLLTQSNSVITCCAVLWRDRQGKEVCTCYRGSNFTRVRTGNASQCWRWGSCAGTGGSSRVWSPSPHTAQCAVHSWLGFGPWNLVKSFPSVFSVWGWLTHRWSARRECLFCKALQYYLETPGGWIFLPWQLNLNNLFNQGLFSLKMLWVYFIY